MWGSISGGRISAVTRFKQQVSYGK
ncbi:hypothetical protein E2C01_027506 [Portunus trituberculatus]|uniref:Uncharacterized protein n=1 Tax=Portunus trituberculatus TaxID=210409 RepID=A0A5B7ELD1_PORTR|nr:hypothetical protein [Portunus trituberculatus]